MLLNGKKVALRGKKEFCTEQQTSYYKKEFKKEFAQKERLSLKERHLLERICLKERQNTCDTLWHPGKDAPVDFSVVQEICVLIC